MTATPVSTDQAYAQIAELGVAALWRHLDNLFPAEPAIRAVPFHWSYPNLRPYLLHFADVL